MSPYFSYAPRTQIATELIHEPSTQISMEQVNHVALELMNQVAMDTCEHSDPDSRPYYVRAYSMQSAAVIIMANVA